MRRFSIRAPGAVSSGVSAASTADKGRSSDAVGFASTTGGAIQAADHVASGDFVRAKFLKSDAGASADGMQFRFFAADAAASHDAVSVTAQSVLTYANGYTYSYRRALAPQSDTSTTLTNWPYWFDSSKLVDSASVMANLKSVANGGKVENGTHLDIRFETTDGVKLDHEVETYDPTTGLLRAYVRIPSWDCSLKYRYILYFGNSGVAADEDNASGVWTAALAAIDPITGTDKSGKGRGFAVVTAPSSGTLIGRAGVYTTTSRLINTNSAWLDGLGSFAIDFWLQASTTDAGATGNDPIAIRVGGTNSSSGTRRVSLRYDEVGDYGAASETILWSTLHSDGERFSNLPASSQDTSRHHWMFSVSAGVHKVWRDASSLTFSGQNGTAVGNTKTLSEAITIGDPLATNAGVPGSYGRIVFWPFQPADIWVWCTYQNQNDPTSFDGIGALDQATVTNKSPVAVPIYATASVTTGGVGSPSAINVLSYIVNPDSDTVTVTAAGPAPNGTVSRTSTTVTYTPSTTTAGTYAVPYTISDGTKTSSSYIFYAVSVGSYPAPAFGWWNRYKNAKGYAPYSGQAFYSGVMSMNWDSSNTNWTADNGNPSASPYVVPTSGQWNTFTEYEPEAVGGNIGFTNQSGDAKRCNNWDEVIGGPESNGTSSITAGTMMAWGSGVTHISRWLNNSPNNTWACLNMPMCPYSYGSSTSTNANANACFQMWKQIANGDHNSKFQTMGARLKYYVEHNSGSNANIIKSIQNIIIRVNWEFNQDTGLAPNFYGTCAAQTGSDTTTLAQATALYNDMMRQFALNLWTGANYRVPLVLSPAQDSSGWGTYAINTYNADDWLAQWDRDGIYDLYCCSWHPRAGRSDTKQNAAEATLGVACDVNGVPTTTPGTPLGTSKVIFTPGTAIRRAIARNKGACFLEAGPIAQSEGAAAMGTGDYFAFAWNTFYDLLNANSQYVAMTNIYHVSQTLREDVAGRVGTLGYTTAHANNWRAAVDAHKTQALIKRANL